MCETASLQTFMLLAQSLLLLNAFASELTVSADSNEHTALGMQLVSTRQPNNTLPIPTHDT